MYLKILHGFESKQCGQQLGREFCNRHVVAFHGGIELPTQEIDLQAYFLPLLLQRLWQKFAGQIGRLIAKT